MRYTLKIVACLLAYGWSSTPLFGQALHPQDVFSRRDYAFPSYEQAVEQTIVEEYASREAYEQAVSDDRFTFEKLDYLSEGLRVVAYLYYPRDIAGKKLPAIIFNRGSTVRGDIAPELIVSFHRLAQEGFVVLAPMLRQSDGGEGVDEVGGRDVLDIMNVRAVAESLGFVDMDQLFMYGESRGGMMTLQTIRRGFPLKAAAVFGAFTSLEDLVAEHPDIYTHEMFSSLLPEYPAQKDELFESRSALCWAEELAVPLLIMHGGADWSVHPRHSMALAQELQRLGRPYELVIYGYDGHILATNQEDRDARAVAWFRRHMN